MDPFSQITPKFNFNPISKSKFISDESSSDTNDQNKNKISNLPMKSTLNNANTNLSKSSQVASRSNAPSISTKKSDKTKISNIETDEDDINNLL